MEKRPQKNNNSSQILNASSSLLGFCFVVITSMKALKINEATLVDELTTVAFLTFMTSTILSFLGMRNSSGRYSERMELLADYIFTAGLFLLFVSAVLITFNII